MAAHFDFTSFSARPFLDSWLLGRNFFYIRGVLVGICFIEVYHSINNCPWLLVKSHGILLKLSYSSLPLLLLLCIYLSTTGPILPEVHIFACVNVRVLELLTQVLWLLKVLQKKSWWSCLHVRFAIVRFSHSLIHLLVDLMGQSLIYKHFKKFCLVLTCSLFGKW